MAVKKGTDKTENKINYGHIIDSNRNVNDLFNSKLTPQTIKMLYGTMLIHDEDYKAITSLYTEEVSKNQLQKGSIKKKDVVYKGNRTWEQVKSNSTYINPEIYKPEDTQEFEGVINTVKNIYKKRDEKLKNAKRLEINVNDNDTGFKQDQIMIKKHNQVDKKSTALRLSKKQLEHNSELTKIIEKKLKTHEENDAKLELHEMHGSGGYDDLDFNSNIEITENIDSNEAFNKLESKPTKSKKPVEEEYTIPKIYRSLNDEDLNITENRRPIFSKQVQELKEQNLSLVDFNISPDETLKVEENQNKTLISLIRNMNQEISYREFEAPAPRPAKPKEIEVVRLTKPKYSEADLEIMRKDLKQIDKLVGVLPASDIHRLNEIEKEMKNKKAAKKKAKQQKKEETFHLNWNYVPSQNPNLDMDKYKSTNYNHKFDLSKKPTLRYQKTYEKQMIYYLEQIKKQHDSGYNRQISLELKNFNNIINTMANIESKSDDLNRKLESNRSHAITFLKKHIILNEQKEQLEIKLLKKHLTNKGKIANFENFIKTLPEFQKILQVRDDIKENRVLLISCLQKLVSLTDEIKKSINLQTPNDNKTSVKTPTDQC